MKEWDIDGKAGRENARSSNLQCIRMEHIHIRSCDDEMECRGFKRDKGDLSGISTGEMVRKKGKEREREKERSSKRRTEENSFC